MTITGGQVVREAVLVIAGAVLAALVIGQSPAVREWIARQWGQARPGCDCARP